MKFHKIIILGLSILFLTCCNRSVNETLKTEHQVHPAFVQSVEIQEVVKSPLHEELTLTGKVEYDPDKIITYTPLVSGMIERTYFSLGNKVKKGQTLAEIRSNELSAQQSEYISFQYEVKIAKRELESARSLYENNMMSEKEYLEAEARLKQSEASLYRIKADMSVYGQDKGDGTFAIKSPMDGYIVEKNITAGSPVSPESTPLFTVADLGTVWIMANVYASNLSFVEEGMEVEISSLSYPGEIFTGKIDALSQVFDPEEKVLKARINMPNPDLKFKPEMSVMLRVKRTSPEVYVSVPTDALIYDNNKHYVVVQEVSGKYNFKEVSLKGHNRQTSYIFSGVDPGENVVVKNQLLIYSSLKEI
ncbi:MAG: efflux RND transporter periplasmic adaptor subunit [Bacteroidales bacterium]|jgi:cobalt-zinc-cadmium efflux system membrane fusion protein|nr:efflux RND transporter periplasmic adaptor subunit [Bacteroidales bacterium]